tara:strand:+ start:424 stop:1833 length:1410 start_codon:yes stop_codon:yes gene_type:complete
VRTSEFYAYGSLTVVESIWWFSILAIVGALLGLGGASIPWFALFLLVVFGMISAWVFGGDKFNISSSAIYQAAFALIVVYFVVASTSIGEGWSFKVAWPVDMFGGTYGSKGAADLVIATIAASFMWYRTQSIFGAGDPARRLSRAFKIGTVFLVFALFVELNIGFDIGIKQLLIPFFGASLIGLAVSRLPRTDEQVKIQWLVVIGGSVLVILGAGAIGGALTARYGNVGVTVLLNIWSAFIDALLWVLRYPIELIMRGMWALILWLQNVFGAGEEVEQEIMSVSPLSQDLMNEATDLAEDSVNYAVDAIRWPLSIILLVLLFCIFIFAYRRFSRRFNAQDDSERESIRGDADAKADMMKLLSSLAPSWMRGRRDGSAWRFPNAETGVAEVFLLYFDTLRYAIKRGMLFDPHVTPNERMSALQVFLPGAPVDVITGRFNAACYGNEPSDPNDLDELREAIERVAEQPSSR